MIGYIALIIFYAFAFLKEAKHDAIISSFEQDKDDNVAWHKLDWQYLAFAGLGISIFGGGYYLGMDSGEFVRSVLKSLSIGISLATLKSLVFNIRINKIFGNAWNYVGSNGLESKFKGKENLYYLTNLILLIASMGYIILSYANIFK